jgi:putative ABC transport system substrate-binding protein
MNRRDFITLLGGATLVMPGSVGAQQPARMRRIGVLMAYAENDREYRAHLAAFREELQKLGWTEGRNYQTDYRWAELDPEVMRRFAKELIALQPDVILSSSSPTTASLLQETNSIPVIFANIVDPVGSGLAASLSRPGGNATGFMLFEASLAGKWLELLKEIAPHVSSVAAVFNPATAPRGGGYYLASVEAAAKALGMEVIASPIHAESDLEDLIAKQARQPNGGLIVMPDAFLVGHRAEVTSLPARYRLPAIYFYRVFTEIGGLVSYGNDSVDNYRRSATYVDRILRGAKPSELPVQGPVKFELVINLKTATALGLTVSDTLLARADVVIE